MRIRFTIPYAAVPKARARTYPEFKNGQIVFNNGKPVMKTTTPGNTKAWEMFVSLNARKAAVKQGIKSPAPHGTPVVLSCIFYMPIPPSWSEQKKQEARDGKIQHTSKPDLSNLLKSIEDGAEGVLWANDSQVVRYSDIDGVPTQKLYGDNPRTEIEAVWGDDFPLT